MKKVVLGMIHLFVFTKLSYGAVLLLVDPISNGTVTFTATNAVADVASPLESFASGINLIDVFFVPQPRTGFDTIDGNLVASGNPEIIDTLDISGADFGDSGTSLSLFHLLGSGSASFTSSSPAFSGSGSLQQVDPSPSLAGPYESIFQSSGYIGEIVVGNTSIGQFQIVPEPTAASSVLVGSLICMLGPWSRRRRRA